MFLHVINIFLIKRYKKTKISSTCGNGQVFQNTRILIEHGKRIRNLLAYQ